MTVNDLDAAYQRVNRAVEFVRSAGLNVAVAPRWDDSTERALLETAIDEYRLAKGAYDALVDVLKTTGALV